MKTIKSTRVKLKQTQAQIAKLIGVSQHRISEIERKIDGRSETITQQRLLIAIELLAAHELLDEFITKLSDK